MIQVYNTETGETRPAHAVDAREMVQRGGWSYEPVEPKQIKPVHVAPAIVEVAAAPAPLAQPEQAPRSGRKPGRKPKSA